MWLRLLIAACESATENGSVHFDEARTTIEAAFSQNKEPDKPYVRELFETALREFDFAILARQATIAAKCEKPDLPQLWWLFSQRADVRKRLRAPDSTDYRQVLNDLRAFREAFRQSENKTAGSKQFAAHLLSEYASILSKCCVAFLRFRPVRPAPTASI